MKTEGTGPAPSEGDGSGASGGPEAAARADGAGIVADAASLLDALLDYLAARFHLEGYRLELRGRELLRWAMLLLAAGAIALFGLFGVSVGIAIMISERLGSREAGPIIVGAFYLIVGVVGAALALRRRA